SNDLALAMVHVGIHGGPTNIIHNKAIRGIVRGIDRE
ncbi:hypothetical protein KIPB_009755, partial [Kipferlia bialata]